MREVFLFVIVILLVSSCSSENSELNEISAMQKSLKLRLKDPESAIFNASTINADRSRGCIVWNAKNSFGGYSEWSLSSLRKSSGRWQLDKLEAEKKYCTQQYFDTLDEFYVLREQLNKEAANSPIETQILLAELVANIDGVDDTVEVQHLIEINGVVRKLLNAVHDQEIIMRAQNPN